MNRITVEHEVVEKLSRLQGQTVVCDSTGRVLGFLSPNPEPVPIDELRLEPPLSVAETQELRKVRAGKPLDEILRRLGVE